MRLARMIQSCRSFEARYCGGWSLTREPQEWRAFHRQSRIDCRRTASRALPTVTSSYLPIIVRNFGYHLFAGQADFRRCANAVAIRTKIKMKPLRHSIIDMATRFRGGLKF